MTKSTHGDEAPGIMVTSPIAFSTSSCHADAAYITLTKHPHTCLPPFGLLLAPQRTCLTCAWKYALCTSVGFIVEFAPPQVCNRLVLIFTYLIFCSVPNSFQRTYFPKNLAQISATKKRSVHVGRDGPTVSTTTRRPQQSDVVRSWKS